MHKNLKIIFFGTGPLAESCLYSLYTAGLVPEYVVTKQGGEIIKKWAELKGIKVLQPFSLKDLSKENPVHPLLGNYDLAIVASYGKIITEEILSIPKYGFINVHPSDLPELRGPSPIESALLADHSELVVNIMKLEQAMDSGPLIIKQKMKIDPLDNAETLKRKAGALGGELIAQILEHYVGGSLKTLPQDHALATFCSFIKKEDGEIDLKDTSQSIKTKWRAYCPWPGLFFFIDHGNKKIRIKINSIDLMADNIDALITQVTPEGGRLMGYEDFKRGYLK